MFILFFVPKQNQAFVSNLYLAGVVLSHQTEELTWSTSRKDAKLCDKREADYFAQSRLPNEMPNWDLVIERVQ